MNFILTLAVFLNLVLAGFSPKLSDNSIDVLIAQAKLKNPSAYIRAEGSGRAIRTTARLTNQVESHATFSKLTSLRSKIEKNLIDKRGRLNPNEVAAFHKQLADINRQMLRIGHNNVPAIKASIPKIK